MWAHLSGVCFTSSGDHSEDKEAGGEGGGGGEVFDLEIGYREAENTKEHFILHLSCGMDSLKLIFLLILVKLPANGE